MSPLEKALRAARMHFDDGGYAEPSTLHTAMDEQTGRDMTRAEPNRSYRGSILPFSRDASGSLHFDPSAGILGSAISGATLPGDVYAGRVDPNSDEGYKRALDLAGLVTGGSGAFPGEANDLRMGIKAYHGSPHDFDRFDVSKIGTGEGAQAYGHGLYFAGNEGVAKSYRDALTKNSTPQDLTKISNVSLSDTPEFKALPRLARARVQNAISSGKNKEEWLEHARKKSADNNDESTQKLINQPVLNFLNNIDPKSVSVSPHPGRMYEVDLGVNPEHLLDWDKPLSEQSEHVKQKLDKLIRNHKIPKKNNVGEETTGGQLVDYLERRFGNKKDVSEELSYVGVPGTRYLDQGSRSRGDGTHNYVIFHHDPVEIMRKYRRGGDVDSALALARHHLSKFGTAPARDAVKSAKAVRGRPVKE